MFANTAIVVFGALNKKSNEVGLYCILQQRYEPVNPISCAVHATYKGAEDTGEYTIISL